ncbi:hypothetical protein NKG95_02905 [Mesorhizobium sp. M1423]|uniref:hypothetical protein n=1 Tax=Mesorhizobium sp. M1423 TaxID=2957101 RepID=UPI003335BBAB
MAGGQLMMVAYGIGRIDEERILRLRGQCKLSLMIPGSTLTDNGTQFSAIIESNTSVAIVSIGPPFD